MTDKVDNNLTQSNKSKLWSLDKVGGNYSPKPSSCSRNLNECSPLSNFLKIKLKNYLSHNEVPIIIQKKLVKVDNKIRTEQNFPVGFMDVITIEKISGIFRILYDSKGRFALHKIHDNESQYKLCKVKELGSLNGDVSFLTTHDGRTFMNPDPLIEVNDTVKVDLNSDKIIDYIKVQIGNLCMVTFGPNHGVVGNIINKEKNFDGNVLYKIKNRQDQIIVCNSNSAFIIGKDTPWVDLPKQYGY